MSDDSTISGNKAPEGNGGGVSLTNGTVTMADNASITGNSAGVNGGGVAVGNGTMTITDGHIANNSAGLNGGGLHLATYVSVTISAITLSGNTAGGAGNGIYVSGSDTLRLAPSGQDVMAFEANNDIYLSNSAGTVAGQVSFQIGADLYEGVYGDVPLGFQTPLQNAVVAIAVDEDMAFDSYEKLSSGTIQFDVNDNEIYISSLTRRTEVN
jgi:hypothetical protein